MSARLSSGDPGIARLIERQMRNWELARSQRLSTPERERKEVEDFICVSRMVGVHARAVVTKLGERLGWPVFDRGILDTMAGDDELRRQVYASMDQRDLGWWEETLRSLMHSEFVRNDYFHRLSRTLLSLARQGACVFLGRGADLVLPQDRGFRVRLIAPFATRVAWYAERRGVDPDTAHSEVQRIGSERSNFIRRHFGVDADDPLRNDLTVNLSRFTPDQAADLILAGRRVRTGG